MEKNSTSAEELKAIRTLMEESSKFLSLSGFAGVFMGLAAIAGAIIVHILILGNGSIRLDEYFNSLSAGVSAGIPWGMVADALAVLVFSADRKSVV